MEQRITFFTLGVDNLARMSQWYQDVFGWTPLKNEEGVCFFKVGGSILGLYPSADLAEDIGIQQDGSGFKRVALAINLRSEKEVDAAIENLRAKGARIIRDPENVFWGGYRGYIADPEDNYWEIVYNPFLELDEYGNVIPALGPDIT